jgi:AP-3 complex subunit mu
MIESICVLDAASTALILQHTYSGRPPPAPLLEHYQSLLRADPDSPPPPILPIPADIAPSPTTLFTTRSQNEALILFAPLTHEPHDVVAVLELLNRICEVLQDYFGREKLGRGIVEGNFDIVEELLGEIVDAGEVMTTEPNALRDIVLPPSLLNKLMSAAGLQGYQCWW